MYTTSIHVQGPASLGVSVEQYGSLLIPVIMDKLPSDMKLQIARKATGEVWQIEELLKTIRIEVEPREASDGSKLHKEASGSNNKSSKPASRTTNSLVTSEGKIHCVYCNGEHHSASCETVADSNQRKDLLRKSGWCFGCLKTSHMSRNCASTRNCRHCELGLKANKREKVKLITFRDTNHKTVTLLAYILRNQGAMIQLMLVP